MARAVDIDTSRPGAAAAPRPADDDPRARLLATAPVDERRMTLAGVPTAVLEGGDGPPVVLLHGPGANATHWLGTIEGLVGGHRVVVPDLPGHGASGLGPGALGPASVDAWLGELIAATCPEPPAIVGHVVGGAIALRFAAAHGAGIERVVAVDALGLAPFAPAPEFGAALERFLARPGSDTHEALWRRCAADLDGLRARMGPRWDLMADYDLRVIRRDETRAALGALMGAYGVEAIPAAELARIAVPVHLVWGRHDLATPAAVAERAARRHGWTLAIIEACADDPPVERPAELVSALHAVLDVSDAYDPATAAPEATRTAWDGLAPGYDEVVTPSNMRVGEEGLRRAGLREGDRFLDVAAGSGALSIPAARRGARVTATDVSPAMLHGLAARARREGLEVDVRAMDGHALALEDAGFDVVGSQFGVMLFPDMPRGLSEMARVTRPGGRVLVTAFGEPREVGFITILAAAIRAVEPAFVPPLDPPPLPFQLRDPARLTREMGRAGLAEVRVDTIVDTATFRSAGHLWSWFLSSNPVARSLLGRAVGARRAGEVRTALEAIVAERAGPDGVLELTSAINIGVGVR